MVVRGADGSDAGPYAQGWSERLGGPAQAVASGRGALVRALEGCGPSAGDDVVVTGWTCVAVPAAVMACGLKPLYADIDGTGNMTVESAVDALTPRTRAVIVQHTLGNPAPTAQIRAALPADIWIIEDLAHAVGSTLDGRVVGRDGDWAVVSTEQSKVLNTGQGGVLAATSERAREHSAQPRHAGGSRRHAQRWLLRTGLERLAWSLRVGDRDWPAQVVDRSLLRLGLARVSSADDQELSGGVPAWRIADLDASLAQLGLRQLSRLDAIIDHRRRIAAIYASMLDGQIESLTVLPGGDPVWLRYPVLLADGEEAALRLRRRGWAMGGRWFNHPIYPPTDPGALGYVDGSCPDGERLGRRILNLPTHPLVREAMASELARDVLAVAREVRRD